MLAEKIDGNIKKFIGRYIYIYICISLASMHRRVFENITHTTTLMFVPNSNIDSEDQHLCSVALSISHGSTHQSTWAEIRQNEFHNWHLISHGLPRDIWWVSHDLPIPILMHQTNHRDYADHKIHIFTADQYHYKRMSHSLYKSDVLLSQSIHSLIIIIRNSIGIKIMYIFVRAPAIAYSPSC